MRSLLPALALASTLALAGCGGEDDTTADPAPASSPTTSPASPESSATATPTPTPTEAPAAQLSVTVEGDTVTPNAQELTATVGEPITIEFTSDRAGELHVHAKPEQYVEFGEGTTSAELVIDVPGSVEIEEHETGAVVAQVEVRP